MAHALQIHPHESMDDLRSVVRTSEDEAQKSRIRAIIALREGATRRELARRPVVDSETITNWIKAYNRGGAQDEPGRPPRREGDPTLFEALAREIDKGGRSWSVPGMVAWIREGYGKALPQRPLGYPVRHLDSSSTSARPDPAKGDPAPHQAFEEGGSRAARAALKEGVRLSFCDERRDGLMSSLRRRRSKVGARAVRPQQMGCANRSLFSARAPLTAEERPAHRR